MKFDEIFERVNELPIEEVIEKEGYNLKKVGSSYCMHSPFRKGSSESSFTISPQKKIFKDWVIPECTGNATKFVSLTQNLTYFEAGFKIALDFGIIDDKLYDDVINKSKRPREILIYEKKFCKSEKQISTIAEVEILDKVFNIFISLCKISENHCKLLKTERGLSEDDIKLYKFFTFPTRAIIRKFLGEIEKNFGNQDVLKGIPGFFKRKGEENYTFLTTKGIGIPIFNENKLIVGIQIRKDTIKEGEQRYTWFSSSFAIDDPKDKTELGTSSGSPIDVVYPIGKIRKGIFITEGKFKAIQIAKKYQCIAISVQGVSTWKPIIPIIKNIETIVKKINPLWEIGRIYTAFDADMACNYNVYKQLFNMTNNISINLKIDIDYLFWDVNLGKGIDDIILNGQIISITNYNKILFDKSYKHLIKKIIEENEEIHNESEIVTKLTSLEFKDYFDKYFEFPIKTT